MQDASAPQVALTDLGPEHYANLEQAMSKILSTALATETFAQIIDGRLIREVYREYYGSG
jgi:hypothetical protein